MDIIKKTNAREYQGQGKIPYTLLMWMYISATTMEISIEITHKTKSRSSTESSYTTPGYIPKIIKVSIQ
jgi:hypothetical protein